MATFHLQLITPKGTHFDETVTSLRAPGEKGSLGILAGHAPMATSLQAGVLEIKIDERQLWFAISAGLLEVKPDHSVLILVDRSREIESGDELEATDDASHAS